MRACSDVAGDLLWTHSCIVRDHRHVYGSGQSMQASGFQSSALVVPGDRRNAKRRKKKTEYTCVFLWPRNKHIIFLVNLVKVYWGKYAFLVYFYTTGNVFSNKPSTET